MSQPRSSKKKQLSSMDNVMALSDQELREALKSFDTPPGPITDSTRSLYRRKLALLIEDRAGDKLTPSAASAQEPKERASRDPPQQANNNKGNDEHTDDTDTSDEDYNVNQDEEIESDDLEYEDDDEEDEEGDEEEEGDEINPHYEELKDKTLNVSSGSILGAETSVATGSEAVSHISRGILTGVIAFFIAIFSVYLYSTSNQKLLETLKPYKNLTKQLLVLALLSPFGYAVYRLIAYYRLRSRQEAQRVCTMVHDALELLQSPDNPNSLLPILHIRDTLLTPAERRAKTTMNLWKKVVRFVEEHESRVKVEMVNIDGEDFRAWKWIGLVKH